MKDKGNKQIIQVYSNNNNHEKNLFRTTTNQGKSFLSLRPETQDITYHIKDYKANNGDKVHIKQSGFTIPRDTFNKKDWQIQSLYEKNQYLAEHNQMFLNQNKILCERIHELQKIIDSVQSENITIKEEQFSRKQRAIKRKNATPQNQRDNVSQTEFNEILRMIKQNNFVASRRKSALILLYITGLRISDLLKITKQNMQDLLEHGKTLIDLKKKNNKKQPIILSQKSCELVRQYTQNFSQLMFDKKDDSFLFTTQTRFDKPINRSSFDTEINNILIKGGEKFNKHIRTHSFRASIIKHYLKDTAIDVVKDIIGHKDINATLQYKKKYNDLIEFEKALHKLDLQRSRVSIS